MGAQVRADQRRPRVGVALAVRRPEHQALAAVADPVTDATLVRSGSVHLQPSPDRPVATAARRPASVVPLVPVDSTPAHHLRSGAALRSLARATLLDVHGRWRTETRRACGVYHRRKRMNQRARASLRVTSSTRLRRMIAS